MCTWNSNKAFFERVLRSTKREIPIHCFILVDRNSTDDTPQVVRRHFPHVRILLTDDRLAKARQLGIKQVDTEYFVFVDDDIILPRGWFARLWSNIDSRTGAIHAHAIPAKRLPYEEEWREWQAKWSERTAKPSEKGMLEVTKKNMNSFWGYTHNTIVRTELCRDWNPPVDLSVFEDHLLLRHIVKKGYIWKIMQELRVTHYSYKDLAEHLRKVKWRVAGGRIIGVVDYSLGQLLVTNLVKYLVKGLLASVDMGDPRILAYVLLLHATSVDGYLQWKKHAHLTRFP